MAPQLDQGRQRRPQAVFFFIFFPGLSVSSCYCLGMLQFWHQSSEVTRPQEPSRSFSPMHCHYDSPLTRVPVTRARHSRHSHSHACEICRALLAGRRILLSLPGGSSQALVYLEINTRDDTQKNLQQYLRLSFNKHNDPVFTGDVILFDMCKRQI